MPSDSLPSAKVIALAPRQSKPSPDTGSGVVVSLRAQAQEQLSGALADLFKAADDDLFRRSEAGDMTFFSGLRVVRLRAPLIRRLFLEALTLEWSLTGPTDGVGSREASGPVELSLVEDSELEESLALAAMVGPVESSQSAELSALRQRWAVLRGGLAPDSVSIPCSPGAVAAAFHTALEGLEDLELPVRIVLYKHFDRHVMGALGGLYRRANEALVAAGILPEIRAAAPAVVRSSTDSGPPPPPAAVHAQAAEALEPTFAPSRGPTSPAVPAGVPWGALRQLMAGASEGGEDFLPAPRRGEGVKGVVQGWGGGGSLLPALPAASLRELGEALAALREIHQLLGVMSASGVAPDQVKEHLLQKLGKDTPEARTLGEHEASIDAIGLVFDHVLNDPNLPAPVQALLARLQVPFIRVAVAEPQWLESGDQPARRLLDTLGEAGKAWSPDVDKDGALLGRIEAVVTAVHDQFSENPGVFAEQLAAFEQQQAQARKQAMPVERRSEQVAQGRDKMAAAQALVAKELVERTAGRPLPEWLRALLLRHWQARMVLLVLRDGEDSTALRRELFFVEKVVGAREEKDDGGRVALDTLIPSLLMQLREGLGAVGVSEEERAKLGAALEAYLTSGTEDIAGTLPSSVARPSGIVPPPLRKRGPSAPAARLEQVQALRINDWVELIDDRGQKTRGKVSWISTVTGRMLLVTVHGLRLTEKTPDELGWMLERGQARVMESRPLFDRAMGSIMERFQR